MGEVPLGMPLSAREQGPVVRAAHSTLPREGVRLNATPHTFASLQGYLAHKKQRPPRTLP